MAQVKENIAFAEHSQPHNLTADEGKLVAQIHDAYLSLSPVACNGCQLCMPCPAGVEVDVARVFDFYKSAFMYDDAAHQRSMYIDPMMFNPASRGDKCTECGECVERCPQKLPVPELLQKAHAYLTEKE
jgi:hypothetical protein